MLYFIETKKKYLFQQENITISNRRYHWGTQLSKRDKKGDRLKGDFDEFEKRDLALYQQQHHVSASPRGVRWRPYIEHRIRVRRRGLAVYATRKYARLGLDKYIHSNRESDEIAVKITNNRPTMIYLGAAELAPNRPIGIKGRKRCPGTRKLIVSVKKLGHSLIKFVDEYFTSQTCANCFGRFPRNTRANRYKMCPNCQPNAEANLPHKIVTRKRRRELKADRDLIRNHPNQVNFAIPPNPNQRPNRRLLTKMKFIYKQWTINDVNQELDEAAAAAEQQQQQQPRGWNVYWHRDIVAAKCILYKGKYRYIDIVIEKLFNADICDDSMYANCFCRPLQAIQQTNTSIVNETATSAQTSHSSC